MNKSNLELLYQNKNYAVNDMNLSNIIRTENNLVNYYSSPFDTCVSTIENSNIHKIDDFCVGINCFDELLFRSELISYARDNF